MEEKSTYINWCDHVALPTLNPLTVMEYFCKPTNPFYDKTCNNEHLRMQGFGLVSEQLRAMEGLEYILLHAQPPDLYVVRKQHRSAPSQETPLVDYYIIRGVVFQAPDLSSVLNVRLLNAVHAVRRALDEASSRGRFSFSKSATVTWMTNDNSTETQSANSKRPGTMGSVSAKQRQNDPDRPPTAFQKMHVDPAIAELVRRFPPNTQSTGGSGPSNASQSVPQQILPADSTTAKGPTQQPGPEVQQSAATTKRSKLS